MSGDGLDAVLPCTCGLNITDHRWSCSASRRPAAATHFAAETATLRAEVERLRAELDLWQQQWREATIQRDDAERRIAAVQVLCERDAADDGITLTSSLRAALDGDGVAP